MRKILENSTLEFQREVSLAIELVRAKEIPSELSLFKDWLLNFYSKIEKDLQRVNYWITLNQSAIFPDLFIELSKLKRYFRLLNSRYLPSLHRHTNGDIASLKILAWIHSLHTQTTNKPFLIIDGDFGIFPTINSPLTYSLPVTSQYSLLHTPLFFHELGHYLYEHHNNEMDQLVNEFQKQLEDRLRLPFQNNDPTHEEDRKRIKIMVETWYEWMQELYCDAVGLEIGGATYLKTFSQYLLLSGKTAFHVKSADLAKRSHPVTMIRIKFLVTRARKLGLDDAAKELEAEWNAVSTALGINEDYFGYYSDDYHSDINSILDDMIIESSPMKFSDFNTTGLSDYDPKSHNYLQLITLAWKKYSNDPLGYSAWERSILQTLSQ
ncbi:MAG: hypothetical protein KF687_12045 [Cyclobacteriaceae bacterium]|nr:hypothetical protein [Cyclobacteriaceae bacterium]